MKDNPVIDFVKRNRSLLKHWLLFVVIMGFFVALDELFAIWINTKLTGWTAETNAWILDLLGLRGSAKGKWVWSTICYYEIIGECTAYYPCAIYVSAVMAFPTRMSRKLLGVGVGLPVLLAFNQLRLVSLCYIMHWIPEHFDMLHVLVWQSVIVVFTVVMWLVWATMVGDRRDPTPA
jgi:archaeosortase B (VPXXXP-CTERM-specific)